MRSRSSSTRRWGCEFRSVIPRRAEGASPESIVQAAGYGFRVRRFAAPRNDNRETVSMRARLVRAVCTTCGRNGCAASSSAPPLLIVGWLVFYPLGIIFEMGLRAEDGAFTLAHYHRVFTEPGLVSALVNSIVISVATTGFALAARAADGLGGGAHRHARPAVRARIGAGRVRDPELHLGDRLDPAARSQCRPDQRVPARDLRHRAHLQHLQHGRPGAGADAVASIR